MNEPLIKGVPDTAFMVAAWRAAESERPDALFRDPFAARLAGPRGQMLAHHLTHHRLGSWQVVVRTVVVDQMIREAVDRGAQVVLNLGAGLDSRPYRIQWPASLRWVDVDFAEVLDWKADRLRDARATCRLDQVKMDLTDTDARRRLLADIGATSRATVILSEGLIPYLSTEAVAPLADDLHALPGASWIVDYFSRHAIQARSRLPVSRQMRAAPFRFQPHDWFTFFGDHGWRAADIRYLGIEGRRLGRPAPLPALMRLAIRLRRLLRRGAGRDGFQHLAAYVRLEKQA